jgi:hypothetical protein
MDAIHLFASTDVSNTTDGEYVKLTVAVVRGVRGTAGAAPTAGAVVAARAVLPARTKATIDTNNDFRHLITQCPGRRYSRCIGIRSPLDSIDFCVKKSKRFI